jgi:hypothetical protein
MADIKLADAVRWLNDHYDAELTYQQLYMYGLQRRIPVDRDPTGRFWEIAEANLPAIGKTLGLTKRPTAKPKPAAKPASKPKPAAKPKPSTSKPARSRAARSASAA